MTNNTGPSPTNSARAAELRSIAARLFYTHGYSAVGMRMIAEAAGVQPASLYHYFASKEEILNQITLEVTRDFIDEHLPLLDVDLPRPARLAHLLSLHITYFWHHRHSMSVGLREMRHLSPESWSEVRAHRVRYQRGIQQFIKDGVAAGEFWCADPSLTGLLLLDMVNGVNSWFDEGGRYTIEEISRRIADVAVHQLLGSARDPEHDEPPTEMTEST